MNPLHGWLVLDKPVGLGSTQAVAAVKRALREAGHPRAKVGHGGTLDPLASGVLPVAVGEATKLTGRLLDAAKAYDFTIAFGVETDTLDAEGTAAAESPARPTLAAVAAVLPRFTGAIEQLPPAYSALKVDGRRAYALARAGAEVALAPRRVTVHALSLADPRSPPPAAVQPLPSRPREGPGAGLPTPAPDIALDAVTLSARVSKGTYVRSLARDIARALGTVGHVAMLRRTKAGPFTLPQAVSLDILAQSAKEGAVQALLLPLTAGLDDIPALPVSPDEARALRQGRRLPRAAAPPGLHLALDGPVPVALVEVGADVGAGTRVVRGFNLMSE